jgi:hypothetical protein
MITHHNAGISILHYDTVMAMEQNGVSSGCRIGQMTREAA